MDTAPAAPDPWAHLNPEQRAAARHGIADHGAAPAAPLLVIAGAGSGKTSTLAHRVAALVAAGADPRAILLLTFSRRAAVEMTRRVERIVATVVAAGQAGRAAAAAATARSALDWAGTFHAIGARLLREYAPRIGLDPAFTIHDREDSADLLNLVRHELGLSSARTRFPMKATCLSIYSRVVNTQASLGEVLAASFPWCADWEAELRRLFAAYVQAKQRQGVLDYDDLLLYWHQAVADAELAAEIGARFEHVLVDEYQDTNRLQASILSALKPDGRGLTVVGDDAQSIYAFRGATVRNILDFPAQFDPPARIVALERNYRSTQPILAASNAVIELAAERHAKQLYTAREGGAPPALVTVHDEADQARYVVERVLAQREAGIGLKSQAVLFRASHHSAQLEVELVRRNVPFVKFGGLKFLDAAHVKDLLACLRWIENPRDRVSGFRVLQLLPGIGPRTASHALDRIVAAAQPLQEIASFEAPPAAAADWSALAVLLSQVGGADAPWPAQFERIRRWYEPHLRRNHEQPEMRGADLLQLEAIASRFASRRQFLTELALDPPDATSDEAGAPLRDEDYLCLSTIHSAKGQEWRAVYLLHVVDGCLPSDLATGTAAEIEEERRLLYVAMTRARDHLDLIIPHRFHVHGQGPHGDRHVYASRTRFLPQPLLPLFDAHGWPPRPDHADPTPSTRPHRIDIAAKVQAMWT